MEAPKVLDAIPGGPIIRGIINGAEHVGRHPLGYAATAVALGFTAFYGVPGFIHSFASVHEEKSLTVEDPGHGDVVAINLDIPEKPLIGYTAQVTGAETVLSRNLKLKLGPLGGTVNVGNSGMTWSGLVKATIDYDPSQMSATYDPGLIKDKTDDKIIVKVPLSAFSIHPEIDPASSKPDFPDDAWSLPTNIISAWANSFTQLKSVPGISYIANTKNETQQEMTAFTQINVLNNVSNECSPKVASNEAVSKAIHANIGKEALLAVGNSSDPALQNLTVSQLKNMKVEVLIGAETDQPGKTFMPDQAINTTNPYTDQLNQIKGITDINLTKGGDFTCELSDEVKQQLANTQDPNTTPSATPSQGVNQ